MKKPPKSNSQRIDCSIPSALLAAVQKRMKRDKIAKIPEAIRVALAEWAGLAPEAAELKPGRRWPDDPEKRKRNP